MNTKHAGGRPSKYRNTQQGLMNFVEDSKIYAMICKIAKKPFSYDAWAKYMGITRQTLYNYMDRSEEWKDAIRQCESLISSAKNS